MSSEWQPTNQDMAITDLVRVEDIIVDDTFQMRADGIDEAVVARYAQVMKANDPDGWGMFPPIKILLTDDTYDRILVAGFHRLAAIKRNGYDEVQVISLMGSYLDGLIIAAGENSDRSQPRTQADIERAVAMCLNDPELSQWSNSQIARWCQCSPQTVINIERRLMSTSKLEVERPELLKYIDKHGNVSTRKRHITREAKKEDIEADALVIAGIPTDDESSAEIERKELLTAIANYHIKVEAIFIYGSPQERETQRGFLLNQYPDLSNFYRKEGLGNEDLQHLSDALHKIVDEGESEQWSIQNEIWNLYWNMRQEIDVPYDLRDDVSEKIAESFPDFANVSDRDEMPIPRLKLLLKEVEAVENEIETNGYQQFLPEGYVEPQEEEETGDKAGEKLAEAAHKARTEANEAFENLMGSDDLSWRITQDGFYRFVKAHNLHHDGVRLTGKEVRSGYWGWADAPAEQVQKLKTGYTEISATIAKRLDWINQFVWELCAEMSALSVSVRDSHNEQLLARELKPSTPLAGDEYQMFVDAIEKAIDETYIDIINKRESDLRAIKEANR